MSPQDNSNLEVNGADAISEADKMLILDAVRERRVLRPLRDGRAWDRARLILYVVTGEHVYDAWQEIKKTREQDDTNPVLPLLIDDFKAKLAAWLNS